MPTEFNTFANPKVETKRFKIYADVGGASAPTWELQGRGVESWTVEENQDVEKTTDVLGLTWRGALLNLHRAALQLS